jgi:hypothetical protein
MISSSTLVKNYSFATHSGHYHFKSLLFKSAFFTYSLWDVYHIECNTAFQMRSSEKNECNFSCILFIQCQSCTKIRFEFQIFILSTDAVLKQSFTLILIWLIEQHCIHIHKRKRILRQIAFSSNVFSRDVSVLIEFNLNTDSMFGKSREMNINCISKMILKWITSIYTDIRIFKY